MEISVPKNLKYDTGMLFESNAMNRLHIEYPIGTSTYTENQVIEFNLGMNANEMIDFSSTYLSFTAKFTMVDGIGKLGAAGFHAAIQQIVISYGANELERINEYPTLYTIMNSLHGTLDSVAKNELLFKQNISKTANAHEVAVFLNLMSIVGSLSAGRYFPALKLNAGTFLRIQLTLAPVHNVIARETDATITNYSITSPRLFVQTTKVGPSISSMLLGQPQLKMMQSGYDVAVRSFTTKLTDNHVEIIDLASFKYNSLRDIFFVFQLSGNVGLENTMQQEFINPKLKSFRCNIAGDLYPLTAVENGTEDLSEAFSHLLRVVGCTEDLSNSINIKTALYQQRVATAVTANSTQGQCIFGLSFEPYTSVTRSNNTYAGINNVNRGLQLELTFYADTVAAKNYNIYICSHYNKDITIDSSSNCYKSI
jgi:hypothetical protein